MQSDENRYPAGQSRHSRCAHPRGGEALPATIFKRHARGGYVPRLLWWPLLRGVILPIRSPRVAKLYQSVWMEEGSPLMVYSRRQEQALAARLPDTPGRAGHELRYTVTGKRGGITCWRRV